MSNENEKTGIDIEEAYGRMELFFEEYKNNILLIAGAIVIVVGGFLAWKYYYIPGQEAKAQKDMFVAESYFDKDSTKQAIELFGAVVDQYSSTPSGNLSEYYLGLSYYKQGDYENAIKHLKNFSSNDEMLAPISVGVIGDAEMQLGKTDEAIPYYLKAAEKNKNDFSSPIYLQKAAMAYESQGKYEDALKLYQQIKSDYGKTSQGRDADKYIARVQTLLNK
ncbi:MAG: tetratricopeptide repeat protein [Bacteroidia bacterium]